MALGPLHEKNRQVQGYIPGGKHPMTTGSEMTPRSTQREVPEGRKSKLKMPRSERTGEVLLSVQSVKRYFRPKFIFLGIMIVRFPSSLPTIKVQKIFSSKISKKRCDASGNRFCNSFTNTVANHCQISFAS